MTNSSTPPLASPQHLEDRGQDPLGHPPDEALLVEHVPRHHPLGAAEEEGDALIDRRVEEPGDREPLRRGDLVGEGEPLPPGEPEEKGTDQEWGLDLGAGEDIIEHPDEHRPVELHAEFLFGLADGGVDEVSVDLLTPSPGEPHMPRPGIIRMGGALDDEDRVGIGDDAQRDGGTEPVRFRCRRGRMRAEVRREPVDGAQCE